MTWKVKPGSPIIVHDGEHEVAIYSFWPRFRIFAQSNGKIISAKVSSGFSLEI